MESKETPRIEAEGVSVTKRYEPEEFAVPTIAFEIRSTRSTAAEVRIEEPLPEGYPVEGVGFHPKYDSERWTAHPDGRLVFESRIEPETTVVTIYGLRIEDDEAAAAFMAEPDLTVRARSPEPDPAIEVVADGTGETLPVPVRLVEDRVTESPATPGGSVAAALAAELRAGVVSREDREALREALDAGGSESERVRVSHLQARVSDLEAYTAAFEGFLDENGIAEALVEELRNGLEELRADVEEFGTEVRALAGEQRSALDSVAVEIDALAAEVDDRGDVAADVDAVSDDLDALYNQVDELRAWREQMGAAFGGR
ncbi:hypothetical protein [Halalkalicoccus tibetensis]|uniref:Uncharacterized protein n=1 Tax=Halalkalicoccus tibetensis TaxID=175632 RepID=A0ABD5V6J0_9EURY